jgi:hypothetical protein
MLRRSALHLKAQRVQGSAEIWASQQVRNTVAQRSALVRGVYVRKQRHQSPAECSMPPPTALVSVTRGRLRETSPVDASIRAMRRTS